MSIFDDFVNEALENKPEYFSLKIVVEKELLHHDILQILSENAMLENLTFIGGTALRDCYGAVRLSEDLDFTGGANFDRKNLSNMGRVLSSRLNEKYGLKIMVSEPIKDLKNVDTWKIKVETRPEKKDFPKQRINIDICSVPSYDIKLMTLINPYGIDLGTNGLIIKVQSREEIYSDKLIAFALRPNRIKYRDIWDIIWLHQSGLSPHFDLIPKKLNDRHQSFEYFIEEFHRRLLLLSGDISLKEFHQEMNRFLPVESLQKLNLANYWVAVSQLMTDLYSQLKKNTS